MTHPRISARPIFCPSINSNVLLLTCARADMPDKVETKLFWWHCLDDKKTYRFDRPTEKWVEVDNMPIELAQLGK